MITTKFINWKTILNVLNSIHRKLKNGKNTLNAELNPILADVNNRQIRFVLFHALKELNFIELCKSDGKIEKYILMSKELPSKEMAQLILDYVYKEYTEPVFMHGKDVTAIFKQHKSEYLPYYTITDNGIVTTEIYQRAIYNFQNAKYESDNKTGLNPNNRVGKVFHIIKTNNIININAESVLQFFKNDEPGIHSALNDLWMAGKLQKIAEGQYLRLPLKPISEIQPTAIVKNKIQDVQPIKKTPEATLEITTTKSRIDALNKYQEQLVSEHLKISMELKNVMAELTALLELSEYEDKMNSIRKKLQTLNTVQINTTVKGS